MTESKPTQCPEWAAGREDASSYQCTENFLHPGDHVARLSTGNEVVRWHNSREGAYDHAGEEWPTDPPASGPAFVTVNNVPHELPKGLDMSITISPDGAVFIHLSTGSEALDSSRQQE